MQVVDTKQSRLIGLHMGSCLFSTKELASFLFEKDVGVKWIAGYSTEVDWIHSSALDLLFLNEFMETECERDSKRIQITAERIRELAPDLANSLGFGIFVRKKGGGVRNLLDFTAEKALQ